ncbi:MAG: phosphoenolpyruvate--protein phosphotransferase [Synergistaceae bacterium]|jgi:phosphotransferase system enzyme I (PtsI)|nr:phosphoenolpyruvate--protein phosphotransferase [Synergistaceae bacterium]
METLSGKGVCGGIAFGNIYFYEHKIKSVARRSIDDPAKESARFEAAKNEAIEELNRLYEEALPKVGEEGAALFEVHKMMIEDLDYLESIFGIIKNQKANAEYAVAATGKNFAQVFASMDDPYMQARSADVLDVSNRLVKCLSGEEDDGGILSDVPVIVAADDLSPSETVQLDRDRILAFVTAGGSSNSHTAILARTLGIPAIIGVGDGIGKGLHGKSAVIDGTKGKLYVEPDGETRSVLQETKEAEEKHKVLLKELKGKPNVTLDGREIQLFANVNSFSELKYVLQNDAGGIGLFRSEFIYLEANDYPSEEDQFRVYKAVTQTMAGRKVIFRTMDIGADKRISYFDLGEEENPALGLRGARLSIDRPDLLRTQLRAMYRASFYGVAAIMFPMISSVWEIRELKRIASEVRDSLTADGLEFSANVELGIMIETPAAALISDELAEEVDFFSIGTNDLTQYTLAVDRQNEKLDRFCDTHHRAVLKLIEMSADNAHAKGIWIGICGELAADRALAEEFLRMKIDELSVSPAAVLELRGHIRSLGGSSS